MSVVLLAKLDLHCIAQIYANKRQELFIHFRNPRLF